MPLETGTYINDLQATNPLNSDVAGQGDDHLRLIKGCVQQTFPQMGGVFGRVISQDTALSISSIHNTAHFLVTNSATATVVMTLPPSASVTSGYFVDITTLTNAQVSLLPSGAASIGGGVSFSIPQQNTARAYFLGGTAWRATTVPNGGATNLFGGDVVITGNLSVSGAMALAGALSVSGAATLGSTLSVSGNAVFAGTMIVRGSTTISGATVLAGGLSVSGATVLAGALTVQGTTTLSGTVVLSVGQLVFPASQNASANANTLDDYEEGTWTPTLAFTTPGDSNILYSARLGYYTKIGNTVMLGMDIQTSTFTFTTASGTVEVTGLPFTSGNTGNGMSFSNAGNVTMGANHEVWARISGATAVLAIVSYNTSTGAMVGANNAQFASGTNKQLQGSMVYYV